MNDRHIVHYICKTNKKINSYIEQQLKDKGIEDVVPAYRNILTALYGNNGKMSMNEVSQLVGKDKSTVTAVVNKLIKLEYVRKEKCTEDRRKTYLLLTRKSRELQDKFDLITEEVYEAAYKNFSAEEKEIFLTLLKRLNNNFTVE